MRPIRFGEKLASDGRHGRGVHVKDADDVLFAYALAAAYVQIYHSNPFPRFFAPDYIIFSLSVSDRFLSKRFINKNFFCARAIYNEMNEIN